MAPIGGFTFAPMITIIKDVFINQNKLLLNDWNSWGPKELVIEPDMINGNYGTIFGVGEPTLSTWGDISFVVVYGNNTLPDSLDVFDCDPWFLPKKSSPVTNIMKQADDAGFKLFPNPAREEIAIYFNGANSSHEVNILNQLGEVCKHFITNQNSISVNLSDLPKGLYIVQYNQQYFAKLVKQ
jgi:hypothetical protein